MKKRLFAIVACALAMCALSAADKGTSFIIKDGTSLWSLKGKTMTWVSSQSIGSQLVSAANGTVKGTYKDAEYDLVKVKTDANEEGYVFESSIARNAKGLAVVTNTLATVYSQPKDTSVLSTIIPLMNIIAVWEVPGKPDFLQFSCYAGDTGTYISEKYILASDISQGDSDVNTALLLQAIKAQPKKEQKQKTLQILVKKYPVSSFSALVAELNAAFTPQNIPSEEFNASLTASDTVNIRDIPSVYGSVIVALKKGDKITSVLKTIASYTIGDKTGKWLKISAPKEGWVFDAYFTAD